MRLDLKKGYSWIDLRQLEMSNVEGNFFIENYKYFDNIINSNKIISNYKCK